MAKQGKALSFSMSCRVPNDRCSICGNEAKSISAYCEHLGRRMGQYDNDMRKYAFAYNDKPTFFDISRVKNPADRIAHFLSYSFNEGDDIVINSGLDKVNRPAHTKAQKQIWKFCEKL